MFDCVATLAEVMGQRLRTQEIVDVLIPLLSRKWQALADTNKQLLPLFECFEQVVAAVGEEFITPYVQAIYERCTRILKGVLDIVRSDARDGWALNEALFLRATELINVILSTLSAEKATQLIEHQDSMTLSLMVEFAADHSLLARQTIFGLLGDIQACIRDPSRVFLPELIRNAKLNLQHDTSVMTAAGFNTQVYGGSSQ